MKEEIVIENNPVIEAVTALMVAMSSQLDTAKLLTDLKTQHSIYLAAGDKDGDQVAAIVGHFGSVLHQLHAMRQKKHVPSH